MFVEIHYEKATNPAHLKELMVDVHLPKADVGARAAAIKRVSGHCTVHETICKMQGLPMRDAVGANCDAPLFEMAERSCPTSWWALAMSPGP